jgi:hypothetical protein
MPRGIGVHNRAISSTIRALGANDSYGHTAYGYEQNVRRLGCVVRLHFGGFGTLGEKRATSKQLARPARLPTTS